MSSELKAKDLGLGAHGPGRSARDSYALQASGLCVKRGNRSILKDITCTLPKGVVAGLVGPSGSGKTTLMRAIVGVQAITGGTLRVGGYVAGSKVMRSKIGYVSQSPSVYEDLTVAENVRYFAAILGLDRAAAQRAIAQVDLLAQAGQLVASLSGGQRARVSLAIALLGNAELFVLDEPTVGLDPVLRNQLWSLFGSLAAEGKTLLISSHVMDEAERCQQLLLLRDGKLLYHGPTKDLLVQARASSVETAFIRLVEGQA